MANVTAEVCFVHDQLNFDTFVALNYDVKQMILIGVAVIAVIFLLCKKKYGVGFESSDKVFNHVINGFNSLVISETKNNYSLCNGSDKSCYASYGSDKSWFHELQKSNLINSRSTIENSPFFINESQFLRPPKLTYQISSTCHQSRFPTNQIAAFEDLMEWEEEGGANSFYAPSTSLPRLPVKHKLVSAIPKRYYVLWYISILCIVLLVILFCFTQN